ncbi:cytochrome c [Campylobacter coli]
MKKIALFFVLFVCLLNLNAKDKEWLPKGESISVYEYIPNNPRSPAAFSSVDSKKLNANQRKGQQVYSKWCIACHGEGIPELLEDRTDLSPDLVTIFFALW